MNTLVFVQMECSLEVNQKMVAKGDMIKSITVRSVSSQLKGKYLVISCQQNTVTGFAVKK